MMSFTFQKDHSGHVKKMTWEEQVEKIGTSQEVQAIIRETGTVDLGYQFRGEQWKTEKGPGTIDRQGIG